MESKGRRVARTAAPTATPASAAPASAAPASAAPAKARAAVSANKPAKPVATQTSARPPEPTPRSDPPANPVTVQTPVSAPLPTIELSIPVPRQTLAQPVAPPVTATISEAAAAVGGGNSSQAAAALPEVVVQRIAPAISEIPRPAIAASAKIAAFGSDTCGMLTESQAAVSRALQALGDELACYAHRSMETMVRTAIDTLAVKTWSDAVALNSRLARTSFDQWVDTAAKVSELGIKVSAEAAKPFLAKLGVAWRPVPPG
jgi:hypothetical protein